MSNTRTVLLIALFCLIAKSANAEDIKDFLEELDKIEKKYKCDLQKNSEATAFTYAVINIDSFPQFSDIEKSYYATPEAKERIIQNKLKHDQWSYEYAHILCATDTYAYFSTQMIIRYPADHEDKGTAWIAVNKINYIKGNNGYRFVPNFREETYLLSERVEFKKIAPITMKYYTHAN